IAFAIDRGPLLQYIWRGFAQPALSVLPPQSWAYDPDVAAYPHNSEKARQMLDASGYRAGGGVTAAIARCGHCARHSHLRVRYIFCRRHQRRFPALFVALDRRERRPGYFWVLLSIQQISPPRGKPRF